MGTYRWYNGPSGWYQASYMDPENWGRAGYKWHQTPMGKAEAMRAKLKAEYEKAYNEAKTANEARYQQILTGFDNLYSDTMTGLEGMGDAARNDIRSGYDRAHSKAMQGLVNAGMANSTIMPSVTLSNTRRQTDALSRLMNFYAGKSSVI